MQDVSLDLARAIVVGLYFLFVLRLFDQLPFRGLENAPFPSHHDS